LTATRRGTRLAVHVEGGRHALPAEADLLAIHKGTLHAYRTNLWGRGLEVAEELESESRRVLLAPECSIFVTGQVCRDLVGSPWDGRLRPVDIHPISPRLAEIEIYRLGNRSC